MVKVRIKKGDLVKVITGSDRGKVAQVVRVAPREEKVYLEGVRQFTRYIKASHQNPEGKKDVHHGIHISNVAFVQSGESEPSKIGYRTEDGKKVRFLKKTGETIQ